MPGRLQLAHTPPKSCAHTVSPVAVTCRPFSAKSCSILLRSARRVTLRCVPAAAAGAQPSTPAVTVVSLPMATRCVRPGGSSLSRPSIHRRKSTEAGTLSVCSMVPDATISSGEAAWAWQSPLVTLSAVTEKSSFTAM